MANETPQRDPRQESELGRGYYLVFGIGLGAFVTLIIGFGVMIAAAPPPSFPPAATLPASGADEVTVIGTEFAYEPDDLVLNPSATITFDNQGQVVHNIEIEGVDGFKIEAEAGQTASSRIDLQPGEYVIFCSIPGHRDAGMQGTLTVATGP